MLERAKISTENEPWDKEGANPSPEPGKKYLLFKEGPFSLAIAIESIRRVHDAEEGSPPRRPGTRMIDLHRLACIETVIRPDFWLEMEIGDGHFLMPVGEVEGIREMNLAIPLRFPESIRKPEGVFISGIFFDGNRMVGELDPAELARINEELNGRGLGYRPVGNIDGARAGKSSDLGSGTKGTPGSASASSAFTFLAGGDLYGIRFDRVLQVITRDEVHPFPGAPEGARRVVYYSDSAVPVIEPDFLIRSAGGDAAEKLDDYGLIVLVETHKGIIGFGCSRIVNVAFNQETENGPEADDEGAGLEKDKDGGVTFIDPEEILDRLV